MEFPVLEQLQAILQYLAHEPICVLESPPGSGKTTVLPLEIMKAKLFGEKKILILEPRRIAAKNAAKRLSQINNSILGEDIGYRIRFDTKVKKTTRIEVVTDGILTRILLKDPSLSEYGLIIFDEFHERSLDSDFCFALTKRTQSLFRSDLRILIMSATLDGISFNKLNSDIRPILAQGKTYPVKIHHQGESERRQSIRLAELIPKALQKHEGDVLVFFSGIGEIMEAERELKKNLGDNHQISIHRLYGDMTFEEQENVFLKSKSGMRKVILSTNIAESSVTIPNVRTVIDTGFCKRAIYDVNSGLTKLEKKRISLSSAKQRAGRSGREAEGNCYRLWSEVEEKNFVTAHPPEILETDISNHILLSEIWGEDISTLPLIDLPKLGIIEETKKLLVELGALTPDYKITPLGEQAAVLPLPLRISIMCLKLINNGHREFGIELAAVFSERKILMESNQFMDFTFVWEKWNQQKSKTAYQKITQIQTQLKSMLNENLISKNNNEDTNVPSLGLALSFAYPDRITRAREINSKRYKMSNGKGAVMKDEVNLKFPEWILILDTDGAEPEAKILFYVPLLEKEIFSSYANKIKIIPSAEIDTDEKNKVVLRSFAEYKLGEVIIKRSSSNSKDQNFISETIYSYFSKFGFLQIFEKNEFANELLTRIKLLSKSGFKIDPPSEESLLADWKNWLLPSFDLNKTNIVLNDLNPVECLNSLYSYAEKELIQKETPTHFIVPSGSKIKIDYSNPSGPFLSVKLQELFGLKESPKIVGGKIALTLHLLSPAGRPVQVTSDLKNFWDSTYHEVKKELKGRYPRHPWPDSPWEAIASKGIKKKSL
ncbi:MAG: ATP-dependent helicase HrpB [Leptospira sp.]|nr:ATP-dependent helicase HrpB [Leptospira sp.]